MSNLRIAINYMLYYDQHTVELVNEIGEGGGSIVVRDTLKQLRKEHQLTGKDIADKIHISKEHYCLIENGKRGLSYTLAVKIASVFGKRPDEIFLNDEVM